MDSYAIKSDPKSAFSPEWICSIAWNFRGDFIAGLEIKPKTNTGNQLFKKNYQMCLVKCFRLRIYQQKPRINYFDSSKYRGALSNYTLYWLFSSWWMVSVTGSLQEIIREVMFGRVQISEKRISEHYKISKNVYGMDIQWWKDSYSELGHATELHAIRKPIELWRAMDTFVSQRGRPLPNEKHLLSTIIYVCNRAKGVIDESIRYLKNLKS